MPSVPISCRFEVGCLQVQNCFKLGKELAPKAHVQVKFCSDPVRSEDYFPEWKPALIQSPMISTETEWVRSGLKLNPDSCKHTLRLRAYISYGRTKANSKEILFCFVFVIHREKFILCYFAYAYVASEDRAEVLRV